MFSDIDGFPIWIRTLIPDPAPEGGVDYLYFGQSEENPPISPESGALFLDGMEPTVSQPQIIAPGGTALTVAGYAPSIVQPRLVSPGAAAMEIAGQTPTVTVTVIVAIDPSSGALSIVGYQAGVVQPVAVSPLSGTAIITGNAPSITQPRALTPSSGAATIAGQAPEIIQSTTTTIDPEHAEIYILGMLPTIVQGIALPASTVTLTLSSTSLAGAVLYSSAVVSSSVRSGYTVTIDGDMPTKKIAAIGGASRAVEVLA